LLQAAIMFVATHAAVAALSAPLAGTPSLVW